MLALLDVLKWTLAAVLLVVTRESLALQKYRDAGARARAALTPMLNPHRKLTQSESRAIVRHVDHILGLSSPEDDPEWESGQSQLRQSAESPASPPAGAAAPASSPASM